MMAIKLPFLWLFAAAAAYMDFRYRKVPNRLVLGATVCASVLSACGGWAAFRGAFAGFALGFLLLLPAFTLRMVGGGDVKSLAVIGLFTGPGLLWLSFLRGVAVAGLAALVLLTVRYALRSRPRLEQGTRDLRPGAGEGAWTLPYAGILALCAAISVTL